MRRFFFLIAVFPFFSILSSLFSQPAVLDWSSRGFKKKKSQFSHHKILWYVARVKETKRCFYGRGHQNVDGKSSTLKITVYSKGLEHVPFSVLSYFYISITASSWFQECRNDYRSNTDRLQQDYGFRISQWHLNVVKFIWIFVSDGNFMYSPSYIMSDVYFYVQRSITFFIPLAIFVAYVSIKDHKSSGFTLCSLISID